MAEVYRCGRCKRSQPAENFWPSQRKNGAWCLDCCAARLPARREAYRRTHPAPERVGGCPVCGESLADRPRNATYCSRRCKDTAKKRRQRAKTATAS